jgi:hypothetical protein
VYLRNIHHKNSEVVEKAIAKMEAAGVPVCHFKDSTEALLHSAKIGLISLC